MSTIDSIKIEYENVWRASLPYMRSRKNDVHIPLSFRAAEQLLEDHPQANRDVVLLGILLHDLGWAVVDQHEMFEQGFGPNMMESDVRIQHEKEGARIATEILRQLEYDPEIIEHVVKIIDGHDTRKTALSLEDQLVKDADKLWRFTVTGIAIACEWFKMTPAQYANRLEREIEGQLFTPTAVKMAQASLQDARDVLKLPVLHEM
jgi:putative nucleotidyltransferase with HDIG domain